MKEFSKVQIINLPSYVEERGYLTYFENNHQIPFKIKGCFLISDFQHLNSHGEFLSSKEIKFILPLKGMGKLYIDEPKVTSYNLEKQKVGFLIPKQLKWVIENSDSNLILLVTYGQ